MSMNLGRSAAALLPDREALARWMTDLGWGRAAERLEPASRAVVVALPDQEEITREGRPVRSRLLWLQGCVVTVAPGQQTTVSWCHTEQSLDRTPQQAHLRILASGEIDVDGAWPAAAPPVVAPGGRAALIAAGRDAEWAMLVALEPFVRKQLQHASASIAAELGVRGDIELYASPDSASVVDGLAIDTLASAMLFGEAGPPAVPAITRALLRRYADAEQSSLRVPLSTYLHRNIAAQAIGRIRSAIGDPMLGPRIRRVAADLPRDATAEEVLERCRALKISGSEPLGLQRVRDALLVPLSVTARTGTGSLDALPAISDPRAEEPFDDIDSVELIRAYRDHCGIEDPDLLWLSFEFEVEGRVSVDRDLFWQTARRLQLSER
ncbi:MAG: hypothetical protein V4737_01255 [Curtobacterium sp.]